MSGRLARLTHAIFVRAARGEKDASFYRDVDEATELARAIREHDPAAETPMKEIERRMKRTKARRRQS